MIIVVWSFFENTPVERVKDDDSGLLVALQVLPSLSDQVLSLIREGAPQSEVEQFASYLDRNIKNIFYKIRQFLLVILAVFDNIAP